jgi:hypothetical protein
VSNAITTQLIRTDFPGLALVTPDQPLDEPLRRSAIASRLQENINDLPILLHGPPQVILLCVDLYEDFIDVEGISVSSVLSLQRPGIPSPKLDTPEPDRCAADDNSSFSQQIFDVSMTEVEPEIEPDS